MGEPEPGRDGKVNYGTMQKTCITQTSLENVHVTLNPNEGRVYKRSTLGCGAILGDGVK